VRNNLLITKITRPDEDALAKRQPHRVWNATRVASFEELVLILTTAQTIQCDRAGRISIAVMKKRTMRI
jgi:hypothetical protein